MLALQQTFITMRPKSRWVACARLLVSRDVVKLNYVK